ncbi:hypothetical protein BGP77_16700 [Saccharospirillum sp. MSK14-1]|uniref:protein kinase domain-containing protein n=1 Tax=Saccharospirillum sp. MSK14-1 TaxID=1897632 RepID=UPI000D35BB30|nr:protein kinase [Saccharospirillum sp. MSK14-1]PTY38088.1 hypothetical protein BGP77_16700 [Saccharospirillum sp. MSK14-1]
MVTPHRLLQDLSANELALPELQSMLPSLMKQGAFSDAQWKAALDEAVAQGWLSPTLAERVRVACADALNDDDVGAEDATVVAHPSAQQPDDDSEDETVIAQPPQADDDVPDEEQLTVLADAHPVDKDVPDDTQLTVVADPGPGANNDEPDDTQMTVIATPQDDDEDDDRTMINTSATSQSSAPTTSSTSQRSWDVPGSTSPQLQNLGPGSIIKDRFILDKVLGAGGMGKVFQARDLLKVEASDNNPFVAMKVLTEDFRAHPKAFVALQREASRQQKLAHPNIVTVYDFDRIGMTGTQVFITMELLIGKPLDTFIRKVVRPRGGLPFDEAFPIIKQLGASLSYAHQRNIVHSDFKPGNAFLCDDGIVKTLDFGIARAINVRVSDDEDESGSKTTGTVPGFVDPREDDDTTATTTTTTTQIEDDFDAGSLGALTPAYASLEMLQGKDPSTQDDLYALACVAYELLTGYHPFNKKSAAKAMDANLIPAPIKGLKKRQWRGLLHGLAFEKENRTETVDDFLEELEGKATWYRNPWVVGPAFSLIFAIAAYNPVMNYLDNRRIEGIIDDVLTGEPQVLEETIGLLSELDVNAQNRITDSGRDIFQDYFRSRIERVVNLDEQRYGFDQAERELARMERLYPDSVALETQRSALELERNRYLHQLSQQLNQALANERLLPTGEGDSIVDVLDRVTAVAPQHSLMSDPRVPDLYATVAQEAINLNELDDAAEYLDVGMTHMPEDIDLINTRDRLTLARQQQQRQTRIAQLQQQFGEQTARPVSWQSFVDQHDAIVELSQLAPGDRALQALSNLAQPLANTALDEDSVLQPENQDLLLALNLSHPDLPRDQAIEQWQLRLQEQLQSAQMDTVWEAQLYGVLNRLQAFLGRNDPTLVQARDDIAELYLDYIAQLEEERRFSLAEAVLDRIDRFALNEPQLGTARSRIQTAYNEFLVEREAAAEQARIQGMQSDLLVQAEARAVDDAERTLAELRAYLDSDDPFLTITAADAMAEAYLELTEELGSDGDYREAVRMADRGLDNSPNDLLLQNTREQYLVEGNIEELNGLFADSDHFDTPAAQVMIDEIRTFAPARYPDLERQYIAMLVERVMDLADTDRKQGESLATRASILFPGSAQLTQLRAELAPAPWTDGRTARVALQTGRLSEARNILESSKARLPEHPEVLDFEKDLTARIAQAEEQFAMFEASLEAQEYEQARTELSEARQMWTDNLDYRSAIATLSEQMAQQRWQGRILQRDVDIRTLRDQSQLTGADISAQAWSPVNSSRPCTEDLGGYGRRARAICFDMLHDQVRGPLMVVVPGNAGGAGFAMSKYEISNEDYNKYCFLSGQCPVNDALDKDLPRTGLNYQQINDYVQWVAERTGQPYRLPTAEEWHYAADAAGQPPPRDYNCRVRLGGQILKGDQMNRVSTGHQNGWGLQNVIGNAQEVVFDGNRQLAIGGSFQDPHAECGLEFSRAYSGSADSITGFRLLLENVQPPALQTVSQ